MIVFIALIAVICVICALCFTGKLCITSAKRPEDQYDGEIETVQSMYDSDHDGIDDQTDILLSALDYVQTRPKYRSAYYGTGYPDDGYGTCTDVIAFAFRNAGLDLMNLLQRDIETNPDDYDDDVGDANIDFRRVRNLHVYFSHTAVSLTTDVSEIEEWQGGDIVIFKDHIGIVSDRRNKDGVPYVIHHANPLQFHYEEDILETRSDITDHYRVR